MLDLNPLNYLGCGRFVTCAVDMPDSSSGTVVVGTDTIIAGGVSLRPRLFGMILFTKG
jgi:hypothetical protein